MRLNIQTISHQKRRATNMTLFDEDDDGGDDEDDPNTEEGTKNSIN